MSTPDTTRPACNCGGAEDGAWGFISHTSNCATEVARLRRFHVGHQIASGKGEVICMTCHMELLSTEMDAIEDLRYQVTELTAKLEEKEREVSGHIWVDGPHGSKYHCKRCGISKCDDHSCFDTCESWITREMGKLNRSLEREARAWLKLKSESDTLRSQLAEARKDSERLSWLTEEAGFFQDDSFTTVKFSGDDATKTWHLDIGKRSWWGGSIRSAIDAAMQPLPPAPSTE